jgi:translation initiation factor 1
VKRPKQGSESAPPGPFHNPFAELKALKSELPAGPAVAASQPLPRTPPPPPRAVIRLERKGRGGKEVTVVEQLQLKALELERWLKELKHALGCGGTVEEGALVFQGDQRQRLKAALVALGVRRISGA